MTAIEKLLAVASAEIGYLEKASNKNLYDKTANAGSANYTKYGYEMHKLYPATMDFPAAWCDAFVDWCFVKAFGEEMALRLLHKFDDYTINSSGYYKNKNQWYKSPKVGDQIFFTDSKGTICHTGLVCGVDKNNVYTIEGNTSSASGVVANGGCVRKKSYPINYNKIAGYGRPNYSLAEKLFEVVEIPFVSNGVVSADKLNIRKYPSTNSGILGEHIKGDTITVSAKTEDGWYRVDYAHIGTGYVFAEYITLLNDTEPAQLIEEYTDINDIVWELYNRGIVTDTQGMIREMKLNENGRLYWLARKAVNYMRNRD